MTVYEPDNLHKFLIEHKEEIDYVVLNWSWSPYYTYIETGKFGLVYGEPWPLYHCVEFNKIDKEYCFVGNVEDAIKYAENYDQWDERKIELNDGMLWGEVQEYNYDNQYSEPLSDLEDLESVDLSYCGLRYFKNDSHGNQRDYLYSGEIYNSYEEAEQAGKK